jgi:polyether ionophore transport system permease protein
MSAAVGSAAPRPTSLGRRIYGFGSVFGKTLRDSRRAILLVGGVLALLLVVVSAAIIAEFSTPASRQELENVVAAVPPILQGLAGPVVNVGTLGGYLSYKYGTFFPVIASLWSILALSGTLAGEARRGSLEFVVAAPMSRRRVALEKLAGHLTAMVIAILLVFLALLVAGRMGTLPGDEIPAQGALGYALWLGAISLAAGGLAFAAAQFVGRGSAIGIAGAVMFAGFILNGYHNAIPALAPFANLTWWGWSADHVPLAGQYDWASVALIGVVALVLLVIGVEAFVRRDIGQTSAIPTPSLPRALVGLRGPGDRTFGALLPTALAWGLGIGIFGFMIAGSGRAFIEQLGNSPQFMQLLNQVFPNVQFASIGGFMQLLFIEFGLVLAGLAAATLVAGWASDETSSRLEFLLATPLSRRGWVTGGGIGILGAVAVIVVLSMIGIALGAMLAGESDLATPLAGTIVLGLFAIAMAGIGVAIGGVFGSRFAGPAAAIVVIVTWFLDILVPALNLPDVVHDLALTAHYGQPMLGQWDGVGIVASVVIAIAGVVVGTWGFRRRDLRS